MEEKIKRFNHLVKRVQEGMVYVDAIKDEKELKEKQAGVDFFYRYTKELAISTQEVMEILGRKLTKEEFINGIEV